MGLSGGSQAQGFRFNRPVPRGPVEWGDILYEEEWAKKRRWEDRGSVFLPAGVLFLSVLFIILGLLLSIVDHPAAFFVAFMGLLLLLAIFPVLAILLVSEAKKMPLRVYERGFTKRSVPFADGVQRKEHLVPKRDITWLQLTSTGGGYGTLHHLKLKHRAPLGGTEDFDHAWSDGDPFVRAIVRILPGDVRRDAETFLDTQAVRKARVPWPEETFVFGDWKVGHYSAPISLLAVLLLTAAMVVLLGPWSGADSAPLASPTGVMLMFVLSALIAALILVFVGPMAAERVRMELYHAGILRGGSVAFRVPSWTKLFLVSSGSIPLSDLAEVRHVNDEGHIGTQGALVTSSGEDLRVRTELVDELLRLPQFEGDGDVRRNRWAVVARRDPVVAGSKWRSFLTFLGLTAMGPLIGFSLSWLGLGPMHFGSPGLCIPVVLMGTVVVVAALTALAFAAPAKAQKIMRGMEVTEEGIHLPNAPPHLQHIPKSKISSIVTGMDSLQAYTEVRTPEGDIKLPESASKELREKGYEVDDSALKHVRLYPVSETWEAKYEVDLAGDGDGP